MKLVNRLLKAIFFLQLICKEADMALFEHKQSKRYKHIQKLMRRTERLITKRKRIQQQFEKDNEGRYL